MRVEVFKSIWGMEEVPSLDEKLARIKAAGYAGVEYPLGKEIPEEVKDLCGKHGLDLIVMVFAESTREFAQGLERAARFDPVLVTAQSGRDRMTFAEGRAFFKEAMRIEKDTGVPVAHETHRYRILYSPWQARPYLEEFPELGICADFSHWMLVCESRLDDAGDVLDLACSRAIHIHARVGYEEGPQVSDPSAPEYREYLVRFEGWWDQIRKNREKAGAALLTVTPEYGPPGYLQTLPHTRQPVADLWEVCLWAANRLRGRWGQAGSKSMK